MNPIVLSFAMLARNAVVEEFCLKVKVYRTIFFRDLLKAETYFVTSVVIIQVPLKNQQWTNEKENCIPRVYHQVLH